MFALFRSSFVRCSAKLLLGVSLLAAAPSLHASNPDAPYNLSKYRPVLDDSKLQAPTSSTLIAHGDFADKSNQYFRLDSSGKYMTFTVSGDSKRSELRQMSGDWQTSTSSWRKMIGEVKVFYPNSSSSSLDQFTFMQIHDSTSLNKPLIRLVWHRSRSGQSDHLWAVIRIPANPNQPISSSNLATQWEDLGPRPSGFFKSEIKVKNNQMKVRINSVTKVDVDVTYWDGLDSYFKAGTYNQDPGTSKVQYRSLKYYQ